MARKTRTIVKNTKTISFSFDEDEMRPETRGERIVFIEFITLENIRVDGVTKFGFTTKNVRDTVEKAENFKAKKLEEGFKEVSQKDFLALLRPA